MGPDPFSWPAPLRDAAFSGIGAVVADDSSAFPRARMAMAPVGREITETMLLHKEEIMGAYGEMLFREETVEEQVSRVKQIINAYDMDAAEKFWEQKFGNPHRRDVRTRVPLRTVAGHTFSLAEYGEASREGTRWIKQRSEGALQYMKAVQEQRSAGATIQARRRRRRKKGERLELAWK